jgi:hypothetical protein
LCGDFLEQCVKIISGVGHNPCFSINVKFRIETATSGDAVRVLGRA